MEVINLKLILRRRLYMRNRILNNKTTKDFFIKHLIDFYPNVNEFILKEVKVNYLYENKVKTDRVDSVSYKVIDNLFYDTFTVKVYQDKPIITQKDLDNREDNVYVSFPLERTVVSLYAIEYGIVKVSIVAPDIEII